LSLCQIRWPLSKLTTPAEVSRREARTCNWRSGTIITTITDVIITGVGIITTIITGIKRNVAA
jgi:hypothetical protein